MAAVVLAAGSTMLAQEPEKSSVPLKRVVLFSSGVGFFEHAGAVVGNRQVDLKFNVEDVNDLLKSMVVRDLSGQGTVSTVSYGSRDPITKTLKTFAIDLTENPTLADVLNQVRGEEVEIESTLKIKGTILGVEKRKKPVGEKEIVEIEVVNLLTPQGLKSVALDQVTSISLTNAKLNADLQQALAVLALGHSADKKTVSIQFNGNGEREVSIGYIQETPIWKTSYRLVLNDEEPPFLQGWAIVENTTEEDWNDVNLVLISGRPISFRMDLYQPLYVPRPLVIPELHASLAPQVYGQDLDRAEGEFRAKAAEKADAAADGLRRNRGALAGGGFGGAGGPPAAPAAAKPAADSRALRLDEGVSTVAQAGEVGELFQYRIESPVKIMRQQSAMLPIINNAVAGEKLSIYNARVHAKHPLNGLKMKNTTDLHLMAGPITVFDDNVYAGDARIEDLPPKSERLISYAMDLDTEVAPTSRPHPEQLLSVRLSKGVLYSSRKYSRSTIYTVKNSGSKPKKVLIEAPIDPSWTLTAPEKPEEKTRDTYRFAVTAEPGTPVDLTMSEEMTVGQQVALDNLDDGTVRFYVAATVVSDKVKKALEEVQARKLKLAQSAAARQQLEKQIATIGQEQDRIRQNMAQLVKNTELYNRYVKKFAEQEDQIETIRGRIETALKDETAKRKELDDYISALEVE